MQNIHSNFGRKAYWGKVCYIFLGLSIAFAVVFSIFWVVRTNSLGQSKGKAENDDSTKSSNDTFVDICPHFELIGDGYCDDEVNTEECMFDLNDCCEMESDRTLCQNCTCILSDVKLQKIHKEDCTTDFRNDLYLIGDGDCNLHFNQAKYFFDADI